MFKCKTCGRRFRLLAKNRYEVVRIPTSLKGILEITKSITFQTPQGRRVKYIKCEVLDEIRNEITMLRIFNRRNVIEIIDKRIAESEVQE